MNTYNKKIYTHKSLLFRDLYITIKNIYKKFWNADTIGVSLQCSDIYICEHILYVLAK